MLMNIYLYAFLELFCSQGSCLSWRGSAWTIWRSSGSGLKNRTEPEHALQTVQEYFPWSIIHVAMTELWSCAGLRYTAGGVMTKHGKIFLVFLETFPWKQSVHLCSMVLLTYWFTATYSGCFLKLFSVLWICFFNRKSDDSWQRWSLSCDIVSL